MPTWVPCENPDYIRCSHCGAEYFAPAGQQPDSTTRARHHFGCPAWTPELNQHECRQLVKAEPSEDITWTPDRGWLWTRWDDYRDVEVDIPVFYCPYCGASLEADRQAMEARMREGACHGRWLIPE